MILNFFVGLPYELLYQGQHRTRPLRTPLRVCSRWSHKNEMDADRSCPIWHLEDKINISIEYM